MAWRQKGDKPLSEPMLTRLIDTYAALGGTGPWDMYDSVIAESVIFKLIS